jgi:DNA-binding transcriptional ArsR family regulator
MKAASAIEALGALAQEHRLALFRMLVQAGGKGMSAGAIAKALGVPNSSLSFHVTQTRNAGLILQERQHRSLIYRANYPAIGKDLVHNTFNCKQFFFRHKPIVRVRRDAPDHASRG